MSELENLTTVNNIEQSIGLPGGHTVQVVKVNHYRGRVRREFPYHYHQYCEISFTFRGDNLLHIGGESTPFGRGQICVIGPETIHAIKLPSNYGAEIAAEADDVWEMDIRADFPESFCEAMTGKACILDMGVHREYLRNSLKLVMQHFQETDEVTGLQQCMLASLYELIAEQTALAAKDCFLHDQSAGIAREILKYIYQTYREPLNLNQLAEEFAVSKSHMLRLFKQQFGITPINYRIDLQMMDAYGQLVSSDRTIQAIADSLNFDTAAYFHQVFARKIGMTPAQVREQYANLIVRPELGIGL